MWIRTCVEFVVIVRAPHFWQTLFWFQCRERRERLFPILVRINGPIVPAVDVAVDFFLGANIFAESCLTLQELGSCSSSHNEQLHRFEEELVFVVLGDVAIFTVTDTDKEPERLQTEIANRDCKQRLQTEIAQRLPTEIANRDCRLRLPTEIAA